MLLDEDAVKAWVGRHMSLALSRDFANTRKHMKRDKASAVVAQIRQIETGPNGQKATIEYWPGSQPGSAKGIDALVLAEQCERDWRALLAAKGIQVPSL